VGWRRSCLLAGVGTARGLRRVGPHLALRDNDLLAVERDRRIVFRIGLSLADGEAGVRAVCGDRVSFVPADLLRGQ
jgi:hypothetical protein